MSAPRVFATGVTGYVGGDALFLLHETHPDWQYTFLVRDASRAASLTTAFPRSRTVTGTLSDLSILRAEAASADIVLHFASPDHVPSTQALIAGLASQATAPSPKVFIQTSGAASLWYDDLKAGRHGERSEKIWDDVADIEAINAFPDDVMHREVDKFVLEADTQPEYANVKTAVVCPPMILGRGRGPVNQRTMQIPMAVHLTRERGRAFQVGKGEAVTTFVHVQDLSAVYLAVSEAAAALVEKGSDPASAKASIDWGRTGFYFVENGSLVTGDASRRIAQRLHEAGVLKTAEVDSLDATESRKLSEIIFASFGANARARATRARRLFGWEPKFLDVDAIVDETIDDELKAKQSRMEEMLQGHMPAAPLSLVPGRS